MRYIYVWVSWGCYAPDISFTGMSQAARHLGVKRNNIQDHMERNGFYKNDQGHLFKVELVKHDKRTNKNLLKK